ncbi:MAG TPA: hypothetical protein VJH05_02165 [Candidatus Paceibacterota bacterium]
MNKHFLTGFLALSFFLPVFSFAEESGTATQVKTKMPEIRQNAIEKRNAVKIEVKEKRTDIKENRNVKVEQIKNIRTDIVQKRNTLKTEIKAKEDALKTNIKQRRDAIKMEAKTLAPEVLKEKRTIFREDVKKERTELREQTKEKREAFKNEAKERIETLKNKLSEEKAKRIEAFFGTMARKFEAAVSRLNTLADRIDARLDKFEDAGKDVSAFRTSLDSARIKINEAESALDKAKEEYHAFTGGENLQENFKKVKEIAASVAQKTKDAHQALVDVINSIKGVSETNE